MGVQTVTNGLPTDEVLCLVLITYHSGCISIAFGVMDRKNSPNFDFTYRRTVAIQCCSDVDRFDFPYHTLDYYDCI